MPEGMTRRDVVPSVRAGGVLQGGTAPIILLNGPPGSGKGTQARRLAGRRRYVHIEVGEQLRSEVRHHSRLGRRISHYVAAGALVPREIVRAEIAAILHKKKRAIARRGAILDGYPRTLQQAKDLLRLLRDADLRNPLLVVNLRGPDRLFVARLLQRGRSDDTSAVARRRLRLFHKATAPILRFLRRRLPVIDVAADSPVVVVARSIRAGLDARHRADGGPKWTPRPQRTVHARRRAPNEGGDGDAPPPHGLPSRPDLRSRAADGGRPASSRQEPRGVRPVRSPAAGRAAS